MSDRDTSIDITGKSHAAVLAALYNHSRPLGMGFIHYNPENMPLHEAQALLDAGQNYFDYLKGRVMKIKLVGDSFDSWGYDRDNGEGAARKALVTEGVL